MEVFCDGWVVILGLWAGGGNFLTDLLLCVLSMGNTDDMLPLFLILSIG